MIQDIEPKVLRNEFEDAPGRAEDLVMAFDSGSVLARTTDDGRPNELPRVSELGDLFSKGFDAVFAFRIDDTRYCIAVPEPGAEMALALEAAGEGFGFVALKDFRAIEGGELRFAIATGIQLDKWYKVNRFCGACGRRTHRLHEERMLECPECGNHIYPSIQPAVIVAVTDGDRLLMTRYAHAVYRQRALVAGFCEIGETAEQTVAREVMEETGVRVKNIRYVGSQPWGFASDLLLGYTCELDGDPTIRIDPGELSTAEWVPREEIFEEDDHFSLTRHLVMRFKNGEL